MNTAALLFYIGRILIVEALAMIPSMTISLLNGEDMSWRAFIVTIATLAVIGLAISLPVSKKNRELHSREGIVIVAPNTDKSIHDIATITIPSRE
ncbi:MAG TPA: hypothetical protein PKZ58_08895 [Bacillota bacterium]|nr:hypothetical protein [Bacillota bacterium]